MMPSLCQSLFKAHPVLRKRHLKAALRGGLVIG